MNIEDIKFIWKKTDGTPIENVSAYIKNYLFTHSGEYKLFIGTDSQRVRKQHIVYYATVICIYNVGHGAHIIYSKNKRNDIKDMFNRLWWEIEYSMSITNELKDKGVLVNKNILSVHIDISPKVKNKSNDVYKSAVGYVTGMGYDCLAKPYAVAASYCADFVVRNKHFNVSKLYESLENQLN